MCKYLNASLILLDIFDCLLHAGGTYSVIVATALYFLFDRYSILIALKVILDLCLY